MTIDERVEKLEFLVRVKICGIPQHTEDTGP